MLNKDKIKNNIDARRKQVESAVILFLFFAIVSLILLILVLAW